MATSIRPLTPKNNPDTTHDNTGSRAYFANRGSETDACTDKTLPAIRGDTPRMKMKCEASQELVVGGFTDPQGERRGLGALLLGYFEGEDFVFAGKVGTGFDTKELIGLRARLDFHHARQVKGGLTARQ
jgi:hypothetical protein